MKCFFLLKNGTGNSYYLNIILLFQEPGAGAGAGAGFEICLEPEPEPENQKRTGSGNAVSRVPLLFDL